MHKQLCVITGDFFCFFYSVSVCQRLQRVEIVKRRDARCTRCLSFPAMCVNEDRDVREICEYLCCQLFLLDKEIQFI